MFGNIMNNKQIGSAIDTNQIKISGFKPEKLKKIHYPLTIGKIYDRSPEMPDGDYELSVKVDFTAKRGLVNYILEPNEFCIVEIREWIIVKEHLVGHFIPSSTIVTKGLSLVAGRIEAPFGDFGEESQMVRFGLKNLTNMKTTISSKDTIAYIYFIDIRGLANDEMQTTAEERMRYQAWAKRYRKAQDDGITDYDKDN